MARAIVRFSMDGEASGTTAREIRLDLEGAGWTKIGTASYECDDLPAAQILDAIDKLLGMLRTPPGGGTVDHLWVYFDEPNPSEPMPRPAGR